MSTSTDNNACKHAFKVRRPCAARFKRSNYAAAQLCSIRLNVRPPCGAHGPCAPVVPMVRFPVGMRLLYTARQIRS